MHMSGTTKSNPSAFLYWGETFPRHECWFPPLPEARRLVGSPRNPLPRRRPKATAAQIPATAVIGGQTKNAAAAGARRWPQPAAAARAFFVLIRGRDGAKNRRDEWVLQSRAAGRLSAPRPTHRRGTGVSAPLRSRGCSRWRRERCVAARTGRVFLKLKWAPFGPAVKKITNLSAEWLAAGPRAARACASTRWAPARR